ncbi:MAG: DUF6259 domain-containing protein [Defluviitaleaceae bacterium]|nr:DUF6259 domain-containing protein [Defluviitaleaceae bacterium]
MSIQLKSGTLHCEFCKETGALTKLLADGWPILNREGLGLSWRMMVPLSEELRNNDVLGEKQKLTSYNASDDGIIFTWDGIESERGGKHPIKVNLEVKVEGQQIVYYMDIDNKSEYFVESIHCPYVGDVQPPGDVPWFNTFSWVYATSHQHRIWPYFDNLPGYFGLDYPTIILNSPEAAGAPMAPFFLMRSEHRGLYAGVKSNSTELVSWMMELRPGWESSLHCSVPRSDTIDGKLVHTRFAAVHMSYIQPGESRSLTPIALEAFEGDWHKGVDIYKSWRDGWMKMAKPPAWTKDPHAWLQLHINSPEDELRMRFTELPKVAEECKKMGVPVIQLVGWNDGGQDQGNPSHSPDPRLGTFEELKNAIAECHAMGIKIILFTKFTWADRASDWFREDLHRLATKDPYGDYYMHVGYKYQTMTQLLDINTKRLIPMCFLSDEYLEICKAELKKVVDLGAAGMLFDETMHHGPALLCFDESHGHRYGAPVYQNDREFVRRMWEVEGIADDFLMAGEACYDWEMDAYQFSYHRSAHLLHLPLSRYLLPHAQFMTAVTGFGGDRDMINQSLMYRYIISYEPYFFKGKLSDFPKTVEYGNKMDQVRTELRKWFWDGEFRDRCDAVVTKENGDKHHPYSVFKAADNSLGLVICNYDDEASKIIAKTECGASFTKYRLIDEDKWVDITGLINVPAHSAVLVL